jgi:uncharacterized protein YdhG (YjbR/CyaY superfamily)
LIRKRECSPNRIEIEKKKGKWPLPDVLQPDWMRVNAGTVSAYLEGLPEERRKALELLRSMIEKAAPQAKPTMKYGLPTWEWNGPIFALASRQKDMELYVNEADLVAKRKRTLGDVEVGTTSVRFKQLTDLNLAVLAGLLADAADRRRGGVKAPRA